MDNHEVKISVIVPCYNGELYIESCINSLLFQNTKEKYEIIVINDGSVDGTEQIILKMQDERIRYIYQQNMGVAYTRRKGVELAKGKYVCFVDADDTVEKEYIQTLYDNVKSDSIPFLLYNKIYNDKTIGITEIVPSKYSLDDALKYISYGILMAPYWRTIFEKSKFLDIKMNNLKFCEDKIFLLEYIYKNKLSINLIDKHLYNYNCFNENSATNNLYTRKHLQSFIDLPFLAYDIFGASNYKKIVVYELIQSMFSILRVVNYKSFIKIFKSEKYDIFKRYSYNECKSLPHKFYLFCFKHNIFIFLWIVENIFRRELNNRKKIDY